MERRRFLAALAAGASALAGAIITSPDSISAAARAKLRPLIGKYVP